MPVPPTISFFDLIKNMDETHRDKLVALMEYGANALAGKNYFYSGVYAENDVSPEANAFRQYLQDNEIEHVGGGNSQIFCVDPNMVAFKWTHWSMPPEITGLINASPSLVNVIAPVLNQIPASTYDHPDAVLQEVPLYQGDVESLAKSPGMSDEVRLTHALHIYTQMASALEDFREANLLFPDPKNENWGFDKHFKLYVVDAKTLLEAPNGVINRSLATYKNYFMSIPQSGPPYAVDKIHSLQLGKNLYQFLTNASQDMLYDPTHEPTDEDEEDDDDENHYKTFNATLGCDANNFVFTADIFQTPVGQRLHKLITQMIQPDPNARLSVKDALLELEALKLLPSELKKSVHYEHATLDLHRVNEYKARLHSQKGDEALTGESLITAILLDFKESLNNVNLEDLNEFVENYKLKDEYKKLEGSNHSVNFETSAVIAFKQIVEEARTELSSPRMKKQN